MIANGYRPREGTVEALLDRGLIARSGRYAVVLTEAGKEWLAA